MGYLARRGGVVVSMNNRVGGFGFFNPPGTGDGILQHVSGNYGQMDQIAALQVGARNITVFGAIPTT